jgi:hypothetical protein
MGMSANYWPPADKAEMITRLRKAVDLGVAFFDTAEAYGPSHLALRRKRSLRASDVILSGAPRPYGGGGSAIRLCKIIGVVRFSTFSTVSAQSGRSGTQQIGPLVFRPLTETPHDAVDAFTGRVN